jgi:hypothetical protein
MASASVVVSALKDLNKSQEVDRYNEGLCRDIQQRLDSKLSDLSIADKALFVNKNIFFLYQMIVKMFYEIKKINKG